MGAASRPFYLRGEPGDEEASSDFIRHVGLAEHFRSVVSLSGSTWAEKLPVGPVTTEELYGVIRETHLRDELRFFCKLAGLGCVSKSIILY